jgi:hypothetical protein
VGSGESASELPYRPTLRDVWLPGQRGSDRDLHLRNASQAAAPTFSLGASTYAGSQSVAISRTTPSSSITYCTGVSKRNPSRMALLLCEVVARKEPPELHRDPEASARGGRT